MDGACLRIVGPINQAADAGMNGRPRAHRARLNCNKQIAVAEPVVANVSSRLAQRDDFRMRGGVGFGEVAIPSAPNHASRAHDHRSDGHFACLQCPLCAAEGFFHPKFVHPESVHPELVHPEFVHPEFVVGGEQFVTSGGLPESQVSVPGYQCLAESLDLKTDQPILAGGYLWCGKFRSHGVCGWFWWVRSGEVFRSQRAKVNTYFSYSCVVLLN